MKKIKLLVPLFLYFFMSLSSIFMKFASINDKLLLKGVFYCLSILTLLIFAFLWQKMLKKFKLSKVYVFKSTTVLWGLILGYIFFNEKVNIYMVIGTVITMAGIIVMIKGDTNE